HHRAPRNAGRLPQPTHQAEAHNPLCGDRVVVTLLLGSLPAGGGTGVLEARCDAQGCALCRASGSLATELLSARPVSEARERIEQFLALVTGGEGAVGAAGAEPPAGAELSPAVGDSLLTRVGPLLEVRKFPGRKRCVTLSWEVFRAALADRAGTAASQQ
ncbi:MAG: hypothetical protein RL685_7750, partial [Pseudomonadota bacterium]